MSGPPADTPAREETRRLSLGTRNLSVFVGFSAYLFLFLIPYYFVADELEHGKVRYVRSNHNTPLAGSVVKGINRNIMDRGIVYVYLDIDSLRKVGGRDGDKVRAVLWLSQISAARFKKWVPVALPTNWNLQDKHELQHTMTTAHGRISHYYKISSTFDVEVDYTRFPKEILNFKLGLGSKVSSKVMPRFKLFPPGVVFFKRFTMPGWAYLGHRIHNYTTGFSGIYGDKEFLKGYQTKDPVPWPRIDITVSFKKKIANAFLTLILPILIITVVSLLSNLFPPGSPSFQSGRPFALLATCLFSIIALRFVAADVLPRIHYLIRFDYLYFFALLTILVSLVANLLDITLEHLGKRAINCASKAFFVLVGLGTVVNTWFFIF